LLCTALPEGGRQGKPGLALVLLLEKDGATPRPLRSTRDVFSRYGHCKSLCASNGNPIAPVADGTGERDFARSPSSNDFDTSRGIGRM
jgi:hypothetical protein